ncbi:unnamed protein product [Schistocephalus solidus]|uniref:Copine domain-containing protein n=1 Tax=Schistocephalus solidus TaxID=70667 RepID=A0A183T0Q3_SCHSO|nr:unnamed protein product [Schistocephalus solidus]
MVERSTQIPKLAGSNPKCATLGIGYDWLMTANKPEMAIPVSLVFVGSIPSYATRRHATAYEGSSESYRNFVVGTQIDMLIDAGLILVHFFQELTASSNWADAYNPSILPYEFMPAVQCVQGYLG